MNPLHTAWRRRSLRLRVTAAATIVLASGLVFGSILLATLFQHRRVAVVDTNVRAEASVVSQLVATGSLPSPLPAPAAANTFAQVLDPAGTVLAATSSASRVLELLPIAQLNRHLGHAFTTNASTIGPSTMRVVAQRASLQRGSVTIVSAMPLTDLASTLSALRNVLLVVVPVVVLAAGAATWLAVSAALQPVDQLRAAADAVNVDTTENTPELPIPGTGDELRRLGETLNNMLRRLHASGERQRAFIADAAHELRSPIASLRTQLEVAIAMSTTPQEWPHVVEEALTDVDRLSRLADDLLLLARLEGGPATVRESVDISEITGCEGSVWVAGDAVALGRMFDNLHTNARRHARDRVEVAVRKDGPHIVITVDDDGPGVPPSDRERVFERWVRLDTSRSRQDGGAGLGLPIARSIARAHGGDIILDTSPLGGLRAAVRLPVGTLTAPLASELAGARQRLDPPEVAPAPIDHGLPVFAETARCEPRVVPRSFHDR